MNSKRGDFIRSATTYSHMEISLWVGNYVWLECGRLMRERGRKSEEQCESKGEERGNGSGTTLEVS